MTKRDYEAFARMFKQTEPAEVEIKGYWVHLARQSANVFASDNPRFDRGRYLKACGVRPEDGTSK